MIVGGHESEMSVGTCELSEDMIAVSMEFTCEILRRFIGEVYWGPGSGR